MSKVKEAVINLQTAKEEIKEWQSIEVGATFEIGRILSEVKESDIPRGEWTEWLESVGYIPRTAQRYMQVYARFHTLPEAEGVPVSKLTELLSLPVDVDGSKLREYIRKAKSMSVRELRNEIRKANGVAPTGQVQGERSNDDTSKLEARIRMLERQVRELAHERDGLKEDVTEANERAKLAEEARWRALFNGGIEGLAPWQILGVSENTTPTEVRKRYRELMHVLHPDKGGDAKLFDVVKKAYDSIYRRAA